MRSGGSLEMERLWSEPQGGGCSLCWYGARMASSGAKKGREEAVEGRGHGVDWSEVLEAEKVHLIFNLYGGAVVMGKRTRLSISSSMLAMCCPDSDVMATRLPDGMNHEFVVLTMTPEWLSKMLGSRTESIYPAIRDMLSGTKEDRETGKPVGMVRSMTLEEKTMARQLSDPPVEEAALGFWYAAKVTEILALHLFCPVKETQESPFCLGQKRIVQERVDSVLEWLEEHLDESLDLKSLSVHVGCAPHYLSRLFSKETGLTISQQLRALRIERAAQLMNSGRFNVTEAAMEVGYNSLSHFTKAFVLEKGVKPSEYLSQER